MKNNASLREIGNALQQAESVLIFPHISPDGDGLGSAIALCLTLRSEGKKSYVILEEEVSEYLGFLPLECVSQDQSIIKNPDATVCVDCSEDSRIPGRVDLYNSGAQRICIDHHINTEGYGEMYYIDKSAAAAAELVFALIDEMGWHLGMEAATCLYVGIVTDTGSFQYSNTTPQTHIIAGALIAKGVDINEVSIRLYQNTSLAQVKTEAKVLDNMQIFADGRAAVSYILNDELNSLGATADNAEHAVDVLRNISGIEVAAFLKEKNAAIRVSMRSKYDFDVQSVASEFGGGGHKKAAGCTINEDMDKAVSMIMAKIAESLEK